MTTLTKARASRAQARITGARTYQGQDCDHGHGGTRYTSNGTCVQCAVAQRHEQSARMRDEREAAGNPMRPRRKPSLATAPASLGADILGDL